MTRERTHFRCRDCGSVALRWAGRCGQCGEWNSLEEELRPTGAGLAGGPGREGGGRRPAAPAVPLGAVATLGTQAVPTGLGELDRVLSGGLMPSSMTLIAGEPGIGKSTLLLQMLDGLARQGRRSLLVSAEESPQQVGLRAARLGVSEDVVWISAVTDTAGIRAEVAATRPEVLVVDSIQTISDTDGGSPPGSVASVRACAAALADQAKPDGPAVVVVGHVTKEGSIAGPRVLEHMVDTVLSFEGDRHHALRILRATKHRFGSVGEIGMWEMTPTGLEEVPDGGSRLLADRLAGVPGSAVFAGMQGNRPLLAEIQALVASPAAGIPPRRSASGYESGRLAQLLAVLDRRAGLPLRSYDLYVSAVGGVRLGDPAADLAVASALASAATGRPVPGDLVAIGEVGLGGELRQAAHTPRRLSEAARLGFRRALVPTGAGAGVPAWPGLRLVECRTLGEALDHLLASRPVSRPKLRVLAGAGRPLSEPEGAAVDSVDLF